MFANAGATAGFRLAINDAASLIFYRFDGGGYANAYFFVVNATGFSSAATGNFNWAGRSTITSNADGHIEITNNAQTTYATTQVGEVDITTTKGAIGALKSNTLSVTFPGGGSATQVTSGLIPAGAVLMGVTARVTTTGTVCTSIQIGDGSTADQWCPSGTAITQNTTCGIPKSATSYGPLPTAREATVTSVGSNCQGLVVAITAVYFKATAATSN